METYFNPNKTELLFIGICQDNFKVNVNNISIKPVSSHKHIGITFETYFVKEHSDSKNKYSAGDIKMLEFLVDNIIVVFAGKSLPADSRHSNGYELCPLLADIFLYSYQADFIQSLLSTGKKQLASRFNLTYS